MKRKKREKASSSRRKFLKAFLLALMSDPTKLAAFRENPDAVLRGTNLSAEAKQALKSGDAEKIQQLLGQAPGVPGQHPPLIITPQPTSTIRPDRHPGTPTPEPTTRPPRTTREPTTPKPDRHPGTPEPPRTTRRP